MYVGNMKRPVRKIILAALLSVLLLPLSAQRLTREEYILKYKGLAVETMEKYGIPASIVMAQALLESDGGNSRLAREANNHFGIKCGSSWNGEVISHDDDARDECFRAYASAEESFADHGRFLDNSPRYDRLFGLKEDDYRAWAHGLRECGYATNPDYGPILIRIIEDYKLHLLDRGVDVAYADIRTEVREVTIDETVGKIDVDRYSVTIDRRTGRELHYNNGVPYIVAQEGDSFASVSRDFRVGVSKLLKYNDLAAGFALTPGDALYIKRKNKRSENGNLSYVVQPGDTPHSISQRYGIRLNSLRRINNMSQNDRLREGQQIRLR